jgi:hypothetical protein
MFLPCATALVLSLFLFHLHVLQPQQMQTLFSTDFPLADKILSNKNAHNEFYIKNNA